MAQIDVRHPTLQDTREVIGLVYRSPNLDNNSPYFYAMMIKEWSNASAVAVSGDKLVGALIGFVRPTDPSVYFAWQTCIDSEVTENGLALRLYDFVVASLLPRGVTHLEMTVNKENRLVRLLLARLARRYHSEVENSILFPGELLADGHYTEELRRISLKSS